MSRCLGVYIHNAQGEGSMRRFSSLAELLPTARCVLAANDPWCIPASHSGDTCAGQLAALLVKKDVHAAWHAFSVSPERFSRDMLSRLLAILPSGAETAQEWWPRAVRIKRAIDNNSTEMKDSGTSADYAVLINLAGKAGMVPAVEQLWTQMADCRVSRDTNVWNQYIQATCDADPRFWPWPRVKSTSFARSESIRRGKSKFENDAFALDELMAIEGVPKNARTFELLLLALARRTQENLNACEEIVNRLWVVNKSPASVSTLTAIIDGFAFHNQLERAYGLVQQVVKTQGDLGLGSRAATQFWTRLLRLAAVQQVPNFFDTVWEHMVRSGHTPSLGAYWIKLEYLENRNQFETMFAVVSELLPRTSDSMVSNMAWGPSALIQSAIARATVGLANTNRALDAVKHIQIVRSLGVEPEQDLDAFLAARGATLDQLELFEEDDDEDHVF